MTPTMKITEPGLYDISNEDYHADPCPEPSLSSSIAKKMMNQTARHAWLSHPRLNPDYEPENKKAFDLGTAAHELLLEQPDKPKIDVLDFSSFQTKAAQTARDASYEAGRTPLLTKNYEEVQAMVKACRAQLLRHEEKGAFTNGKPEQTLIWQEKRHNNIWCRVKKDWLPDFGNVFSDYKSTTDASPEAFARTASNLGYDIQAAFYLLAVERIFDIAGQFRFVVQEIKPPYALAVYSLSPQTLCEAFEKIEEAMSYWAWCLSRNAWPGYSSQTQQLQWPIWAQAKWLDRRGMKEIAEQQNQDLREQLLDWQAPLPEESSK